MIITDNVAGISSESLKIPASVEFRIGDRRPGNTISISIYRSSGYMPILCPLFLQIRQWFDKNYRDVYVDLAVGVAVWRVDRLLITDRRVGPCHYRGKHVNPMLFLVPSGSREICFAFLPSHPIPPCITLHLIPLFIHWNSTSKETRLVWKLAAMR